MIAYVVGEHGSYEGWTVAGVFSSREAAEACAAKNSGWSIEEHELDRDDWAVQWAARAYESGPHAWSYARKESEIRSCVPDSRYRHAWGRQALGRTREEALENLNRAEQT